MHDSDTPIDDLTFGVHVVEIQGVVKSRIVGPTNSSGQPVYSYLGVRTSLICHMTPLSLVEP